MSPFSVMHRWIGNPSELRCHWLLGELGLGLWELLNRFRIAWEGLEFRLARPRDVRTGDGDPVPRQNQIRLKQLTFSGVDLHARGHVGTAWFAASSSRFAR